MIQIIVGTETGTAEYVADEIIGLFEQNTITAEIVEDITQLSTNNIWLICTSTHGAGDVPNNLTDFKQQLELSPPDLSKLKFAVIGLGDSSYDTYCFAGCYFSEKLTDLGATEIFPMIKVDAMQDDMPEDIVIEQITPLLSLLK